MLVQCSSCHTTYKVADSLITTANPTFRCSRCKHVFVLGIKPEASPVSERPVPSPTLSPKGDSELSFSFTRPEKKVTGGEESTEVSNPDEPKQSPTGESTDQAETKPSEAASSESSSPPNGDLGPTTIKDEPPSTTEGAPAAPLTQEKEESWTLTSSPPQETERLTIPEENRPLQMEDAGESVPQFEDEWQESLPLLEERTTNPDLDPYRDRPLSVAPYVSLCGALLLFYSLFTLMYQAQPKTIEAAIKTIPWLGPVVLKNNYLRQGITLQSLRPSFQTIQGNREVFVLSGVAVNRSPVSVREIRVEGHIFNAEGKEIDRQIISVGNAISSKIIRDLTAQEISILQRLNPQKRFEISPDESAGFVIVFLKPSTEVKNFSCRVLSVDAGA